MGHGPRLLISLRGGCGFCVLCAAPCGANSGPSREEEKEEGPHDGLIN